MENVVSALDIQDDVFFNHLREQEYNRLDESKHAYLDYTGGNLYAISQIEKHLKLLNSEVLGNPHSTNPTSLKATHLVEEAREKVLSFFNAHDYYCVFTQNASASLKIIGESYPFGTNGALVLLADNHNSVNGIREYCNGKGGKTTYVPVQYEDLEINSRILIKSLEDASKFENKLFAFPAQSNVSGVKHDLKWVEYAQNKGFDVLLDAAAYVPSSKLDLSKIHPDFVSISFYKIFGYPTGIGCLLIRKSAFHKLQKPWFAGGTVTLVSVATQNKFLANGHERFEDGTINYLNIPAVKIGLDYIESIGIERISKRVRSLIEFVTTELQKLHHENGKPIVKIFGPKDFNHRGGNIIMNFFDVEGHAFPFEEIEKHTNKQMISIRSGCFCNPGIDEINNCLTTDELATYFVSRDNGNYYDMIAFLGKMRGATRLSVGIATTQNDLVRFIEFVQGLKNKTIQEFSQIN
ncbi:MAG: aminotransferase class V-fold PLP-dependent enzyme [Raineya sp.]|jgi:selenocysteine lyase/cysteine desulfurase|nr:aminotransferase class V-fold PLP-dependent enzyme [Raineya sp.]